MQPLRILALGDSYTIGEGVSPEQRWIEAYAAALRRDGVAVEPPLIIARTGWTTDELDAAITAESPSGPYDLVTLLIGVNDQYRGREAAGYRDGFRRLLDRAIGFAGNDPDRVVVLSIPDWGVTPFARDRDRDPSTVAREIDAYNRIALEETSNDGVTFVDVTAISRMAASDPSLLAPDALHPSGAMYRLWSDAVRETYELPQKGRVD